MNRRTEDKRTLKCFLSVIVTLSMVMSLMPSEAVAEMREELLGALSGQTSESSGEVTFVEGGEVTPDVVTTPETAPPSSTSTMESEAKGGGLGQTTELLDEAKKTDEENRLSDDLADFVSGAKILAGGYEYSSGLVELETDEPATVALTFTERTDKQLKDTGELTYRLPLGFLPDADQLSSHEPLIITYVDDEDNKRYPVELGKDSWWITEGTLHLLWQVRDAENRTPEDIEQALKTIRGIETIEFEVKITGTFAEGESQIDFGTTTNSFPFQLSVKAPAVPEQTLPEVTVEETEKPQDAVTTDTQETEKPLVEVGDTKELTEGEGTTKKVEETKVEGTDKPQEPTRRTEPEKVVKEVVTEKENPEPAWDALVEKTPAEPENVEDEEVVEKDPEVTLEEPETEDTAEAPVQEVAPLNTDEKTPEPVADDKPAEATEAPAEVVAPEAVKEPKATYVFDDANVHVTATLSHPGSLPDDAILRVVALEADTQAAKDYLEALNVSSDANYTADNTLLYDVTFYDANGMKIEPSEGTVSVAFKFKRSQLSRSLEAPAQADVAVTHLPIVGGKPVAEPVDASVSVLLEAASFTTEGFSAFAFSYTVDFTYDGYTYQLPGLESVALSKVLQALNITESVANVSEVTFTNPALLSVEKNDVLNKSDWILKSLQSFDTPEKLTVVFKNGTTYVIEVTDPATSTDLKNFVQNASISAPTTTVDGVEKYKMVEGESYTVSLAFAENDTYQLPTNDSAMTYQLPTGLAVETTDPAYFNIKITDADGAVYTLPNNTYQLKDNNGDTLADVLEVKFNAATTEPDKTAWEKLKAANNARFSVSYSGDYDGTTNKISFSGDIDKDIVADNTNSVSASKYAEFDLANKQVKYTVTVTSSGRSTDVQVKDTISDPKGVLSLRANSISATSSTGAAVQFSRENVSGNTFDYVIPTMKNGEVVTFTYYADIDTTKIPDGETVVGNNKIQVSNKSNPTPVEKEVKTTIDYTPKIQKDGMDLDKDGTTFHCSYSFNSDAVVSGANRSMTDTLGEYLTLDGTTGITVTALNRDGSVARAATPIAWGDSNDAGSVTKAADNKSFTFRTPAGDANAAYKYVVTYDVKVTGTSGLDKQIVVDNTVETDNGKKSKGTGVWTPSKDNKFELYKTADKIDYANREVTWTATINVPKDGLAAANATLIDTLPGGNWIDGVQQYDSLAEGSGKEATNGKTYKVEVTGLQGTDGYNLVVDDAAHTATFNFYQNGDSSKGGLSASTTGYIVTVKVTTTINAKWLAATAENAWLQGHTNTVKMHGETATATANVAGVGVEKTSAVAGYRTVNGVQLPVYEYTLILKNVTSADQTILDYFDRSLLTPLYAVGNMGAVDGLTPNFFAWHTTTDSNNGRSDQPVSYIDVTQGATIAGVTAEHDGMAIRTNTDSMITDANSPTGFPPKVKIVYYLTVKDEAALKKIQALSVANDGTYTIGNEVKWNDSTDGATITYKYQAVDKEMLTNASDLTKVGEDIYADFRIRINPGAATINNGAPYDARDTVNNLSILQTSIKIADGDGNSDKDNFGITYDMEGDNLIFHNVPDAKSIVVTYRARVKFSSTGVTGQTVDVDFSNDVSMLDYEDRVTSVAHRKNDGEGAAEIYSVNLLKYETGNMSKKLNGAKFQLFNAKRDSTTKLGWVIDLNNPVKDGEGNDVTFTTSGDNDIDGDGTKDEGAIVVKGDQSVDGWSIKADTYYFLREIEPPDGYKLIGYDPAFMVSADGTTNYDKYIYHSGDTLTAKNTVGTYVNVKKEWTDYTPQEGDKVTVKLQQRFLTYDESTREWVSPENGWSDEIRDADGVHYIVDANGRQGDGAIAVELTLNAGNDWAGSFNNLPAYVTVNGNDTKVEYQIKETTINGVSADTTIKTNMASGSNNSFTWRYDGPFTRTYVVYNTPKVGSLKIKKAVTLNGSATTGTLADGTYTFTVKGAGASNASVERTVSITIENGEVTGGSVTPGASDDTVLEPDSDGYIEVGNLPEGSYTITEDELGDSDMTLTAVEGGTARSRDNRSVTVSVVAGVSGTVVVSSGKASFTNNLGLGGLQIVKRVTQNGATALSDRAKSKLAGTYTFSVYTDSACTTLAKTKDGTTCTGTITINADGTAASALSFNNLTPGIYYIKETASDNGLTLSPAYSPSENRVGRIEVVAGGAATRYVETVTNDYPTGALKIKKNVTINGKDASTTADFGTDELADGEYTFQVYKGTYKTGTQVARVKIYFEKGVAVKKTVGTMSYPCYEWIDERTQDAAGKNVLHWHDATLNSDGTVQISGFEPGAYEVHEIENQLPTGMSLVGGNGQGGNDQAVVVTAGETAEIPTASFTNNREEYGELELSKSVISSSPIVSNQVQFTFTVKIYKSATIADSNIDESINGNYGDITFEKGVATIGLKNGEKVSTGMTLPTGLYYQITEANATNFELTNITGGDAKLSERNLGERSTNGPISKTKSSVVFENKLQEGNLRVSKQVKSNTSNDRIKIADENKYFNFTITLTGSTLTGTYGEKNNDGSFKDTAITFTNGVASFRLKHKEEKYAVGLPVNTPYVVTETSEDGFTTTWEGNTSDTVVADTTKEVIATNTREFGELELSKKILTNAAADTTEFSFTVTLSDKTITGTFGGMTFTNGVASDVKVRGGSSVTTGKTLPVGIAYTVTEKSLDGYTLAGVTGDTGTIKTTKSSAVFTNRVDDGGLLIYKRANSASSTDQDFYYPFRVTLYTDSARTTIWTKSGKVAETDDISYQAGVAYVFLKDNQQAVSTGIPEGYGYRVEEVSKTEAGVLAAATAAGISVDQIADISRYNTVVQNGATGATVNGTVQAGVISDKTSSARYTNTHINGSLTVSKKLISDAAADKNQEFNFTVKVYKSATIADSNIDTSIDGTFGGITFNKGVATDVKVKGGASVTTGNTLPIGLYYQVTESAAEGFTLEGITRTTGTTTTSATAAQISSRALSGSIVRSQPSTVEFTNKRVVGGLKVSKKLLSSAAADNNQKFSFKVVLSDTSINGPTAADGSAYGATFRNGETTLTVTGAGEATINNLPLGLGYTVSEDNAPGFTLTGVTLNGSEIFKNDGGTTSGTSMARGAISTTQSTVEFANRRDQGEIVLTKRVVSDATADQDSDFELTITLYQDKDLKNADTTINNSQAGGSYTYPVVGVTDNDAPILLSNGTCTVTLNKENNWTASAKGLPTGVYYKVTETKMDGTALQEGEITSNGWTLTGVSGTGTDIRNGKGQPYGRTGSISSARSTAAFVNTRDTGKLTVSKKLVSDKTADKDRVFNFYVRVYKSETISEENIDTGFNGTYSGVRFTNGESGPIAVKGDSSKTIEGLPLGIHYQVTEDEAYGFTLTKITVNDAEKSVADSDAGADGVISLTESKVTFENTRDKGGFSFNKKVSGTTQNAAQGFVFTINVADVKAAAITGTGFGTYRVTSDAAEQPISWNNGSATITLRDSGSAIVENLPLGATYTVTEAAVNGFSTSTDEVTYENNDPYGNFEQKYDESGKVTATLVKGVVTAKNEQDYPNYRYPGPTFTNEHDEGSLVVRKTVQSNYAKDKEAEYTFRVELSDRTIHAVTSADSTAYSNGYAVVATGDKIIPFVRGVATFALKDGEQASIAGLPAGITYTVDEATAEGITRTYSDVVTETQEGEVNTVDVGTSGRGTIVAKEVATTTVTNTRQYGQLAVTKTVVSHTPADKTKDFTFRLTFYKDNEMVDGEYVNIDDATYTIKKQDGTETTGSIVYDAGSQCHLTFTLKDGETLTTSKTLPLGIYYKVEEENEDTGLTTVTRGGQVNTDTGKITASSSSPFTNIRSEGGLFVYKNVDSHMEGDENKSFDFTVALYNDEACTELATNVTGTYGDGDKAMKFQGGVATFSLKDGEFAYAINLPQGLWFKAVEGHLDGEEANADFTPSVSSDAGVTPLSADGKITYVAGYEPDGTPIMAEFDYAANAGGTGQIVPEENRNVHIVNSRKAGNLKVEKHSPGGEDVPSDDFFFTVELADKSINGTYGDMIFNDGVATFTLKMGESASTAEYDDGDTAHEHPIGTLPVGMHYKVTERNANGYSTSWVATTWANASLTGEEGKTDFHYTYNTKWRHDDIERSQFGLYSIESENEQIDWTDGNDEQHYVRVENPAFSSEDSLGELEASWTKGDHTTGWGWTEGDDTYTLAVTDGNEDKVTFFNIEETGSLTIYKRVQSTLAGDKDKGKKFRFHVQLLDSVDEGAYGDMYFDADGVGYTVKNEDEKGEEGFLLADGEYLTASGLPKGIRYQVSEDADASFDANNSNDYGVVGYGLAGELELISDSMLEELFPKASPDIRSVATYTNVRKTGALRLSKLVDSPLASDTDATYEFEIRLDDTSYKATFAKIEFIPMEGEDGQTVVDEDGNIVYAMQEFKDSELLEFNGGKASVKLKGNEYAHFYNTEPMSDPDWRPAEGEHAYIPVDDDLAYPELEDALPFGVGYTIRETNSGGLTAQWAGTTDDEGNATGTVALAALNTETCTNKRETAKLTLSKDLISDAVADQEKIFTFTVELYEDADLSKPLTLSGKYGGMTFATRDDDGTTHTSTALVQVKANEAVTAEGLPRGVYYKITEKSADGFTCTGITVDGEKDDSITNAEIVRELSGEENVVEFENTRALGALRFTKAVNYQDATNFTTEDAEREFDFVVRLSDSSINGAYPVYSESGSTSTDKALRFENGRATVKLKRGEYASAMGLPTGVSYYLAEENTGYYTQGLTAAGTPIEPTPQERVFTNYHNVGSLGISKSFQMADGDNSYQDEEFAFTVTLYDSDPSKGEAKVATSITSDQDNDYGIEFKRGVANITLDKDNDWYLEASNLPDGLWYQVTENMTNDQKQKYELVNQIAQVGEVRSTLIPVSFTNKRIYHGDLRITKTIPTPVEDDAEKVFTIKVTLYEDNTYRSVASGVRGKFGTCVDGDKELEFVDGVATVTLSAGEHASAKDLVAGMGYVVEEVEDDVSANYVSTVTYTIDGSNDPIDSQVERVITNGIMSLAEVKNDRQFVNASIKKVWNKNGLEVDLPESITVELLADNKALSEHTYTLTARDNWATTVRDLPRYTDSGKEIEYTWQEKNLPLGWELDEDKTEKDGSRTTITNIYEAFVAGLYITKEINMWGKAESFTFKLEPVSAVGPDGKDLASGVPPMPKGGYDTVVATKEEPDPEFGDIHILEPGVYTYKITEQNDHVPHVTYDEKPHTAAITVIRRDTDGKLVLGKRTYDGVDVDLDTEPYKPMTIKNTTTPDKPGFDKKIKDANDSTGEKSVWQDSADYDIGDSVPYRLTATLPDDVTSYKKYHITFTDKMETSLDFEEDSVEVYLMGTKLDEGYTLTKDADNHGFTVRLDWGDGEDLIADATLNKAKVEVYFTAKLNSTAALGKDGNVNAAKLAYSNNYDSDKAEYEKQLPWDYVIAFTYKLDVSKLDPASQPLEGAEFALEKFVATEDPDVEGDGVTIDKLKAAAQSAIDTGASVEKALSALMAETAGFTGGAFERVACENGQSDKKNVFTAKGIDDGLYRLTETKAPDGYTTIDPLYITVVAGHVDEWERTSSAEEDVEFWPTINTRTHILTDLTGNEVTGLITLTADEKLEGLSGDVTDKQTKFQVKKTVKSGIEADKTEKTFDFTVTLEADPAITGTYGEMEFKSNVATFSLKHGETKTATGLPLGTKYKVEEANADGFTTTSTGAEGTIDYDDGTVVAAEFTNTKNPSFDKKIKDVNDSTGEESDWQDSADYDINDAVPFRLTATLAGNVTDYKQYHLTFTDKMEESLTYNKDAVVTVYGSDGVALDPATYTVERLAENEHDFQIKLTWKGEGGATIADDKLNCAVAEVLFTAKLNEAAKLGKEGNVNAAKLAYSNNPDSADDSDEGELPWDYVIAFTYKLDVSKVDPAKKALQGAEFKLEKFEYAGDTTQNTTTEPTSGTDPDAAGGQDTQTQSMTVIDDTVADPTTDPDTTVDPDVTTDPDATTDPDTTTDPEPTPQPQPIDINNTIRSAIVQFFAASEPTGTVEDAINKALGITKGKFVAVDGLNAQGEAKNVFVVKGIDDGLYRLSETKAPEGYDTIADVYFFVEAGHVSVWDYTSPANEDVKFSPESRQQILESLTGNTASGVVTFSSADKVTLNGTVTDKKEGETELKVTKTVRSSYAADLSTEFNFTVTLSDKTITGTFGEMTFTNGVATFKLKSGESKTATGLPEGITYEVVETEANKDGFTTTSTGTKGTLEFGKTATAAFTNSRPTEGTGRLSVHKTVLSNDSSDRTKLFTFRVQLSDPTVNGLYGDMLFTLGSATFTLASGQTRTAIGLPLGVTYVVSEEEANTGGFTTTSLGAAGRISAYGSTAAFTNSKYEYNKKKTSVALRAHKNLTGRALLSGEFSFILKDSNGKTLQTKTNDASGNVAFDAIEYTSAGTYNYTIEEVRGASANVTYDTHSASVTVKVTEDSNGNLTATATYGSGTGATFTNTYTPPETPKYNTPTTPTTTPTTVTTPATVTTTTTPATVVTTGGATRLATTADSTPIAIVYLLAIVGAAILFISRRLRA